MAPPRGFLRHNIIYTRVLRHFERHIFKNATDIVADIYNLRDDFTSDWEKKFDEFVENVYRDIYYIHKSSIKKGQKDDYMVVILTLMDYVCNIAEKNINKLPIISIGDIYQFNYRASYVTTKMEEFPFYYIKNEVELKFEKINANYYRDEKSGLISFDNFGMSLAIVKDGNEYVEKSLKNQDFIVVATCSDNYILKSLRKIDGKYYYTSISDKLLLSKIKSHVSKSIATVTEPIAECKLEEDTGYSEYLTDITSDTETTPDIDRPHEDNIPTMPELRRENYSFTYTIPLVQ